MQIRGPLLLAAAVLACTHPSGAMPNMHALTNRLQPLAARVTSLLNDYKSDRENDRQPVAGRAEIRRDSIIAHVRPILDAPLVARANAWRSNAIAAAKKVRIPHSLSLYSSRVHALSLFLPLTSISIHLTPWWTDFVFLCLSSSLLLIVPECLSAICKVKSTSANPRPQINNKSTTPSWNPK